MRPGVARTTRRHLSGRHTPEEGGRMASKASSTELSQLFTRKASGLVRVAGGTDTFIFSIGLISVGAGIFTWFFFRAFYPGSSFMVATLVAGAGSRSEERRVG